MSLIAPAMSDPAAQKQVRDVLTKIGRAHAPGFLSDEAAVTLLENLVAAYWWLAFKDGEAVVEANLKEFEALDAPTRAQVLRNVNAQSTVVIVSQRISTVAEADQIVVVDDGQVVGVGTHATLLETCPTYAEFADSQSRGVR